MAKQSPVTTWNSIPFKGLYYTSFIINVVLGFIILVVKRHLPPIVPFFYGKPQSDSQLTSSLGLLIAPTTTMVVTFLNGYLSLILQDLFIKKILAVSSLLFSVLLAITVIKIISLVGFF